jgi:hypothetical protein
MQCLRALSLTVTLLLAGCGLGRRDPKPTVVPPLLPPASVTVPGGTEMVVRTVETVDVSGAVPDKRWAAVLARDVRTPEGLPLISAGSPLYLGITNQGGELRLLVQSVVWRGNSYIVNVPVTPGTVPLERLEPWGPATRGREILLAGTQLYVPGQTLLPVRLGADLVLR